jgi:hypothetical protein
VNSSQHASLLLIVKQIDVLRNDIDDTPRRLDESPDDKAAEVLTLRVASQRLAKLANADKDAPRRV